MAKSDNFKKHLCWTCQNSCDSNKCPFVKNVDRFYLDHRKKENEEVETIEDLTNYYIKGTKLDNEKNIVFCPLYKKEEFKYKTRKEKMEIWQKLGNCNIFELLRKLSFLEKSEAIEITEEEKKERQEQFYNKVQLKREKEKAILINRTKKISDSNIKTLTKSFENVKKTKSGKITKKELKRVSETLNDLKREYQFKIDIYLRAKEFENAKSICYSIENEQIKNELLEYVKEYIIRNKLYNFRYKPTEEQIKIIKEEPDIEIKNRYVEVYNEVQEENKRLEEKHKRLSETRKKVLAKKRAEKK